MASDDEHTALLGQNGIGSAHDHVPASVARRLYVSHFLSTWNSRVFEFGAVLYLAAVFPGTLLPMSLYALVRGLSAIVFAPAIGWYIDMGNRLQVVRVSIGELSCKLQPDISFVRFLIRSSFSEAGSCGILRPLLCFGR